MSHAAEAARHLRAWSQLDHPGHGEWPMWKRQFVRLAEKLELPLAQDLVPEFEAWSKPKEDKSLRNGPRNEPPIARPQIHRRRERWQTAHKHQT
jgi:hypothetical protein